MGRQGGDARQGRGHLRGDARPAEGPGEDAHQGDPDLHRGQEAVGVRGQLQRRPRPGVPPVGPLLQAGRARGGHGQSDPESTPLTAIRTRSSRTSAATPGTAPPPHPPRARRRGGAPGPAGGPVPGRRGGPGRGWVVGGRRAVHVRWFPTVPCPRRAARRPAGGPRERERMLDGGAWGTGLGAALVAAPVVLLGLGLALLRGAPQASPLRRQGRPRRRGRGPGPGSPRRRRRPPAPAPGAGRDPRPARPRGGRRGPRGRGRPRGRGAGRHADDGGPCAPAGPPPRRPYRRRRGGERPPERRRIRRPREQRRPPAPVTPGGADPETGTKWGLLGVGAPLGSCGEARDHAATRPAAAGGERGRSHVCPHFVPVPISTRRRTAWAPPGPPPRGWLVPPERVDPDAADAGAHARLADFPPHRGQQPAVPSWAPRGVRRVQRLRCCYAL